MICHMNDILYCVTIMWLCLQNQMHKSKKKMFQLLFNVGRHHGFATFSSPMIFLSFKLHHYFMDTLYYKHISHPSYLHSDFSNCYQRHFSASTLVQKKNIYILQFSLLYHFNLFIVRNMFIRYQFSGIIFTKHQHDLYY